MAAPVPAVERANRILDMLAQNPRKSFPCADLASTLGIHRATCFSILACLAQLGLVERDQLRKTYSLGPELVRLGTAAVDRYPGVSQARLELFGLARLLDVGGLLCVPVGPEFVIVDRVGCEVHAFGVPGAEQVRVPLAPPIGAIFVAWSMQDAIEEWLSRAPATASADDMEAFRRSVTAVRARGYSIGSEVEVKVQLDEILARFRGNDATGRHALALELADLVRTGQLAVDDPVPDANRAIGHLIGPVFDQNSQVIMTFTIFGRPGQINHSNISDYAKPLLEAGARVTDAVDGRWPERSRGARES
ncbi:MAG TPA: helix-turn-helix domain-containing protein [Acidimicrobiales bacterium]|nr:helix-turn-helix domain-containing protein [Acidimicrobiales bacterium]